MWRQNQRVEAESACGGRISVWRQKQRVEAEAACGGRSVWTAILTMQAGQLQGEAGAVTRGGERQSR